MSSGQNKTEAATSVAEVIDPSEFAMVTGANAEGELFSTLPVSTMSLEEAHFSSASECQIRRRLISLAPRKPPKGEPIVDATLKPRTRAMMNPTQNPNRPLHRPSQRSCTPLPAKARPAEAEHVCKSIRPHRAFRETEGSVLTADNSSARVLAILDTGASRCVMGDHFLKAFLSQLDGKTRAQTRVAPSSVRFRFGNNQSLTSQKRLLLPLMSPSSQLLWLSLEIVPGRTPLLFSKRAIKQLGGIINTINDSCRLTKLGREILLSHSPTGLYLLDLSQLCTVKMPCPTTSTTCSNQDSAMHAFSEATTLDQGSEPSAAENQNSLKASSTSPVNDANLGISVPGTTSQKSTACATQAEPLANASLKKPQPNPVKLICSTPFRPVSNGSQEGRDVDSRQAPGPSPGGWRRPLLGQCRSPEPRTAWPFQDQLGQAHRGDVSGGSRGPFRLGQMGGGASRHVREALPQGLHSLRGALCSRSRRGGEAVDDCPILDSNRDSERQREALHQQVQAQVPFESSQKGRRGRQFERQYGRPRHGTMGSRGAGRDHSPGGRVEYPHESSRDRACSGGRSRARDSSDATPEAVEQCNLQQIQGQTDQAIAEIQQLLAKNPLQQLGWSPNTEKPDQSAGDPKPHAPTCVAHQETPSVLRRFLDQVTPPSPAVSNQSASAEEDCWQAFLRAKESAWDVIQDSMLSYNQPLGKQLDLLEVYTESDSRLTSAVEEAGGFAMRFSRRDGDPATIEGQKKLFEILQVYQPKHVHMSPDCKHWGSWSRYNSTRSQVAYKELMQNRRQELVHVRLCERVCQWQRQRQRHFHFEQPQQSQTLKEPDFAPIIQVTKRADVDMCSFGLRTPVTQKPIRKRTCTLTTCPRVHAALLQQRCPKDHVHQQIAGSLKLQNGHSMAVSRFASSYCKGFAEFMARLIMQPQPAHVLREISET